VDAFRGNAFREEVAECTGFGYEVQAGKCIRHDTIDLLGHRPVKAAEAGLDVDYRYSEFGSDEGSRKRGIDVADNNDGVGAGFEHYRLDALHNFGCLSGVGAGANAEVEVWAGDFEIAEEHAGHLIVIMLARVDNQDREIRVGPERVYKRREFHEIGASAANAKKIQEHGWSRRTAPAFSAELSDWAPGSA
jgi:hypothetical protein